jgi:hypothetical protein
VNAKLHLRVKPAEAEDRVGQEAVGQMCEQECPLVLRGTARFCGREILPLSLSSSPEPASPALVGLAPAAAGATRSHVVVTAAVMRGGSAPSQSALPDGTGRGAISRCPDPE